MKEERSPAAPRTYLSYLSPDSLPLTTRLSVAFRAFLSEFGFTFLLFCSNTPCSATCSVFLALRVALLSNSPSGYLQNIGYRLDEILLVNT